MNGQIELVLLPVADVDRAKQFYVDRCGFELIVDHAPNDSFRIVQCQPSGSACAIGFGIGIQLDTQPGSVRGLHVMVTDIVAARDDLAARGVEVAPVIYYNADGTSGEGPHPERADYNSFASFADPDGNGWLLQERGFSAAGTKAA
jgi:catechol 2,3-dioxygenase-like lactoylglutathione lyase family enzyme